MLKNLKKERKICSILFQKKRIEIFYVEKIHMQMLQWVGDGEEAFECDRDN